MAYAIEDLINMGLREGGVPLRIADIFEGSEAAKIALEVYGQTRDELLRDADWSFSRRTAPLTLLKGPPPPGGYSATYPWNNTYPTPGFLFEYAYPDDCLDLRAIAQQPGLMPDLDPLPALWRVDNDPTPNVVGGVAQGPAAKVILCNVNQALATYRAQITDPGEFDSGFIAALAASLGEKFATAFGADPNEVREAKADAQVKKQTGADVRG